MLRFPTTLTALVAGVALLASACTPSSNQPDTASSPEPTASRLIGAAATSTRASDLRSELSYLLEEHVQLVALATRTALAGSSKSSAAAVLSSLDVNAVALSEVIGQAFPKSESPLLATWRQQGGFFLDYARAKGSGNSRAEAQARSDLDGFRTSFGLLINSVIPALPADAVTAELKPHVEALYETIDAQAAGDRRQFTFLRTAAGHMQSTAALLAGGIASDLKLSKTETPAADLRSGLTALLTQHVYALNMAVDTALAKAGALQDPLVKGAAGAVDATAVALGEAVGSVYPSAEQPFVESWRRHSDYVLDYALAKEAGSATRAAVARKDLDAYPQDLGQLINSIVVGLPATTVADQLTPVVADLLSAVDADLAGRADGVTKLRTAASRLSKTASTLAGAIAEDKKLS